MDEVSFENTSEDSGQETIHREPDMALFKTASG